MKKEIKNFIYLRKLFLLIASLTFSYPSFSNNQQNQKYQMLQNVQKNIGRFDSGLANDCRAGLQYGSKMGKSPLGKAVGGAAGFAGGAAKNYMSNFSMEKCKMFFKGGK